MKCTVEGYVYYGRGRTKKFAKEDAAFNVLEDLGYGDYCEGYEGKVKSGGEYFPLFSNFCYRIVF